jgi:hypothetical protein
MTELEKYMSTRVAEEFTKKKANEPAKIATFKTLVNDIFTANQMILLNGNFSYSLGTPTFTFTFFGRRMEIWAAGNILQARYDTTRKDQELTPRNEWSSLVSYLSDSVPFEVRYTVQEKAQKNESAANDAEARPRDTATAVCSGEGEEGSTPAGAGTTGAKVRDS